MTNDIYTYLNTTESYSEMERIGSILVLKMNNIYTPKMLESITKIVKSALVDASLDQIQSTVYRSIYNYWMYGVATDEFFYYGFDNLSHNEKLTYMTNRWRVIYVDHLNKREDRYLLENKYEGYKHLSQYYLRDVIEINGEKDRALFHQFVNKHHSFVVKPGGLALGMGVYKIDEEEYDDVDSLFSHIIQNNKQYTKNFHWSYSQGVVLEELIDQDPSMAEIHPESVNGVRITTVRIDDKVNILHPWLKIGAQRQFVTSAAFGAMGAGINPLTGIVETPGVLESRARQNIHPDTGFHITGFKIPKWNEALALAKKLASSMETLNYVGWDLVLTSKGWCLMEGNVYGDFMWQLHYNKGTREEFENLIGWKSEKQYWWE